MKDDDPWSLKKVEAHLRERIRQREAIESLLGNEEDWTEEDWKIRREVEAELRDLAGDDLQKDELEEVRGEWLDEAERRLARSRSACPRCGKRTRGLLHTWTTKKADDD